nr:MAG TPA: RNA polymerase-like protein [Caudoviricetes sp.]
MTRKAIGFWAVGFLSSSVRNTYRCKNCGYKW